MYIDSGNAIKGQSYVVYFSCASSDGTPSWSSEDFRQISKDGGSFTPTTNDLTVPQSGIGKLVLTSDEMNADRIDVIVGRNTSARFFGHITIFTRPSETSVIPTANSSISEKITAIFQYLFYKRTITTSKETLFKEDGTTELADNTVSDNGTTFTKGKIS